MTVTNDINIDHQDLLIAQGAFADDPNEFTAEYNDYLDSLYAEAYQQEKEMMERMLGSWE